MGEGGSLGLGAGRVGENCSVGGGGCWKGIFNGCSWFGREFRVWDIEGGRVDGVCELL